MFPSHIFFNIETTLVFGCVWPYILILKLTVNLHSVLPVVFSEVGIAYNKSPSMEVGIAYNNSPSMEVGSLYVM